MKINLLISLYVLSYAILAPAAELFKFHKESDLRPVYEYDRVFLPDDEKRENFLICSNQIVAICQFMRPKEERTPNIVPQQQDLLSNTSNYSFQTENEHVDPSVSNGGSPTKISFNEYFGDQTDILDRKLQDPESKHTKKRGLHLPVDTPAKKQKKDHKIDPSASDEDSYTDEDSHADEDSYTEDSSSEDFIDGTNIAGDKPKNIVANLVSTDVKPHDYGESTLEAGKSPLLQAFIAALLLGAGGNFVNVEKPLDGVLVTNLDDLIEKAFSFSAKKNPTDNFSNRKKTFSKWFSPTDLHERKIKKGQFKIKGDKEVFRKNFFAVRKKIDLEKRKFK